MKVAIATDQNMVSGHFGHCEGFTIYEVEGNVIKEKTFSLNPGHQPGYLPNFLNSLAVKVVIAGGMGGGAIQIFNELGIQVIMGISGSIDETIQTFLSGQLKSTGSICHEHQHAGHCHGK